jgi:hypothetical protein
MAYDANDHCINIAEQRRITPSTTLLYLAFSLRLSNYAMRPHIFWMISINLGQSYL